MAELNFETGVVTFTVNGEGEVSFNPTDIFFVERLYAAFELLDKKQEEREERIKKAAGKKEIFELGREFDTEMREIVDSVFDAPVSKIAFGNRSAYAVASGFPVWCNFMLAVMDEIDTTFTREQKLTNPRISKYTAKYHK